ncbi:MAG: HAD hydrolase-like protein [bacterium]
MKKQVIFDLDGTITNTLNTSFVGIKKSLENKTNCQFEDDEIYAGFGLTEEGIIKSLVGEEIGNVVTEEYYRIFSELLDETTVPFDGMVDLIKELKQQGCIISLVTGKGEPSCVNILNKYDIFNLFDAIETGSQIVNRKAEAIEILMHRYNHNTNDVIYIGDAISDVEECKKVGVKCISAGWAVDTPVDQLNIINAGNVAMTVADLRDILLEK